MAPTFQLDEIQSALQEFGIDAWLLYDFRGSNPLARRVLGLDGTMPGSRRLFYFVPAVGTPRKLVHELELAALDQLSGEKQVYSSSEKLRAGIVELLRGCRTVAMEYSPLAAVPTISRVDAGTVELIRSCGVEVVTSGDLIQLFDATWSDDQWAMHMEADRGTRTAFDTAWELIRERVIEGHRVTETEVQSAIATHLRNRGLTFAYPATVAVGRHSSDPHYAPSSLSDTAIASGDFVLIDLWAKVDRPRAVYSDLTCVGYVGEEVPVQYSQVFSVVAAARDRAIDLVRDAFAAGTPLKGWEVDRAARAIIDDAGYGAYFIHRTGHNIGEELHGSGANIDDFETREERLLLRRTCFSIEPGVYLPDFGIRSEVDVFVDGAGSVHVTGVAQTRVLPILRASES